MVPDKPDVGGGVCEVGNTLIGWSASLVKSGLLLALRNILVPLDEEFAYTLGGPQGFVEVAGGSHGFEVA